jgi:hypothetical protein
VVSERRQMHCPHGRPIARRFSAHVHSRERSRPGELDALSRLW